MNVIKLNGVGFNADSITKKTESDFIRHGLGLYFLNYQVSDREALLKQVYALCCEKCGIGPSPDTPAEEADPTEAEPEEPEQ